VENNTVSTGDDGICPKTSAGWGPLRNLTVYNCTVRSRSSALKFGSATDDDISDVLFENITIGLSHRGIGIQLRDKGNIYNIKYKNIFINHTQF